MPKKEDDNPLEEIQKQLRDLMNNKNVQVAFAPFMESMKGQTKEPESANNGGGGTVEPKEEDLTRDEKLESIRGFDRRPKEIRDYLDRFVIKQEQAKRVLSVAVCDHYNHVRRCLDDQESDQAEYVKPNVLLLLSDWSWKNFPNAKCRKIDRSSFRQGGRDKIFRDWLCWL